MISALVRGELNWAMIRDSARATLQTCGMIIWIGIGAAALVGVYNLMGGNRFISQMIMGLDVAPIVIMLVMIDFTKNLVKYIFQQFLKIRLKHGIYIKKLV